MNPFSLVGKTILVTGASSGIGRAVAVSCSQQGATLIITGRNEVRLAETFSMLEGVNHLQISADLTLADDMDKLVEQLPKLDGMVNNAGIAKPLVLQLTETEDVNEIMQLNALAPIHLTRLVLQHKKLNKGASLVYISSVNGNNCAYIGSTIYAASKSALTGFMKGVALELAPRGIRANCINPGMIETDLLKDGAVGQEELESDRLKYPLKRYGKPEEVAYAAVYLLSDATQWITGSSLLIDGGYTLQ
ncbi:MAG: SDR family NAD(P)-dependent oxidoreductase [Paludibacter sp.]|nr:SDR family NAD(P)-dependent oxidoreductase [Paludibacter sp.]